MKFLNLYNIIIESRLNDYKLQLKDQQLAQNIFNINNPKKEKMIIKWIKNGSIKYPKDMQIIDKVYQIINRKGLDYNKFNNPQQILNHFNQLNQKINYNPDNQKYFTNKVQLGKGVVVYNVQNDFKGLKAVRRAVDYNWGKDANPWCLVTPPLQTKAFQHWNTYNAIQKRICFQNNRLIAFCASRDFEVEWWDRNDKPHKNIPIEGVEDDPNALNEIKQLSTKIYQKIQNKNTSTEELQEIYQKYKYVYGIPGYFFRNLNCPINLFYELVDEFSGFLYRQHMLKNPNCPIDILEKIYKEDKDKLRCKYNITQNLNCPQYILKEMSEDKDWYVREHVAKNPNTSKEILQKLSNDQNYLVRIEVAKNPNTSLHILQKLSKDKSLYVKSAAEKNPNFKQN